MRITITDKFLWDLYDYFQSIDEAYGAISPKSFRQLQYQDLNRARRNYAKTKAKRKFGQFVNYLIKHGYIKAKTLEGIEGITLTPKGLEKAFMVKNKFSNRKKRKDGRWVMVIFDIPENLKKTRNFLRKSLVDLGYQQLQKSVWICPYDIYSETETTIRLCEVSSYVRIFLINEVI